MITGTARQIQLVSIDRTDGGTTHLGNDDRIYHRGRQITLVEIAAALADPTGWIEYDTEAQWQSTDEREPWRDDAVEPWRLARARLYARAVVQVMVVYDEEVA